MQSAHLTSWPTDGAGPTTREIPISQIPEALGGENLVWIDLVAPTMAELTEVGRPLGLQPLEIEDAIAPRERPKASQHRGHASFVVYALTPREDVARAIRADRLDGETPATEQLVDRVLEGQEREGDFGDALFDHTRLSGFVFAGGVLTVRSDPTFSMHPVAERWAELRGVRQLGPYGLVHGLLDVVVDELFEVAQFLDDRIEDLEEDLFIDGSQIVGFQRRAYALRKELVALRRIVLPMRDVLSALWRRRAADADGEPVAEAARLDALYADLTDHVLRVTEWTESLRDMIATVFETHLSLQDQRLNEVMRKLAGWAAVISVPTLVTGWFGMNVPYPGQDSALGLVLAAITVLGPPFVLWVLLRRRGWL